MKKKKAKAYPIQMAKASRTTLHFRDTKAPYIIVFVASLISIQLLQVSKLQIQC